MQCIKGEAARTLSCTITFSFLRVESFFPRGGCSASGGPASRTGNASSFFWGHWTVNFSLQEEPLFTETRFSYTEFGEAEGEPRGSQNLMLMDSQNG